MVTPGSSLEGILKQKNKRHQRKTTESYIKCKVQLTVIISVHFLVVTKVPQKCKIYQGRKLRVDFPYYLCSFSVNLKLLFKGFKNFKLTYNIHKGIYQESLQLKCFYPLGTKSNINDKNNYYLLNTWGVPAPCKGNRILLTRFIHAASP